MSKEMVLEKAVSAADRTIDNLEKAWLNRPPELSIEEQKMLLQAIDQAKELRRMLAHTKLNS